MEIWQAIASIAACFAAIVALIPIFQASAARKAKARNLRMRIATKLTRIRPTFAAISNNHENPPKKAILTNEGLVLISKELEILLSESESLYPVEQDRVSQFVANLELMIPMYEAGELNSDGAENLLLLCDRAISEFEENGMLHTDPHLPWEKNTNA